MAVEFQTRASDLASSPYAYKARMSELNEVIELRPQFGSRSGGLGEIDFTWCGSAASGASADVEFLLGPVETADWVKVPTADGAPNVVHHVQQPILAMRWTYKTVSGRYVVRVVSAWPVDLVEG